jgi:hypothetical protein
MKTKLQLTVILRGMFCQMGKSEPWIPVDVQNQFGGEGPFPCRQSTFIINILLKHDPTEDKCMCKLYAHERRFYKVMSRNHTPEDKCMCKLYAHERQAEQTSKLLPKKSLHRN